MSSVPKSIGGQAVLELRSWPAVDELRRTWPVAAGVLAAVAAVQLVTGRTALGLLAAGVLLLVTWRAWVPVRFEIGPGGITQHVARFRRRIPWAAIARYEIRPDGMLLLPDDRAAPIDRLRGLWLPWPDDEDDLIELVRRYAVYSTEVVRP
jgi:hypothetical protein